MVTDLKISKYKVVVGRVTTGFSVTVEIFEESEMFHNSSGFTVGLTPSGDHFFAFNAHEGGSDEGWGVRREIFAAA